MSSQIIQEIQEKVEIHYFTDPLCCWSWAMEPQFKLFKAEYGNFFNWKHYMCGLIQDWQSYNDSINSITKPIQMGPLWMEAKTISGMPMHDRIWFENPPSSSYPSCLAVKTAELQSSEASEALLRCLRESLMLDGKDISDGNVIYSIAENLSQQIPQIFDLKKFYKDYTSQIALQNLKNDIKEQRFLAINRLPTCILRSQNKSILITGYQEYQTFKEALLNLLPDLNNLNSGTALKENEWERLTEKEKRVLTVS